MNALTRTYGTYALHLSAEPDTQNCRVAGRGIVLSNSVEPSVPISC